MARVPDAWRARRFHLQEQMVQSNVENYFREKKSFSDITNVSIVSGFQSQPVNQIRTLVNCSEEGPSEAGQDPPAEQRKHHRGTAQGCLPLDGSLSSTEPVLRPEPVQTET